MHIPSLNTNYSATFDLDHSSPFDGTCFGLPLRCNLARCLVGADKESTGVDIAPRSLSMVKDCLSPLMDRPGIKLCACRRTNVGQRLRVCKLTCRSRDGSLAK